MSGAETDALLTVYAFGLIPVSIVLYVIPSIVAFRRRHPNRYAIMAINLALGGTGIGWIGALVWALGVVHLSNEAGGSHGGESGLNLYANDVRPVRLVGAGLLPAGENGAAAPTVAGVVAEIERLSALRTTGHLTEVEFADLKADALRRLTAGTSD